MKMPVIGDRFDHWDGGTIYIVNVSRSPVQFQIQRRPPCDSEAEPKWVSLQRLKNMMPGGRARG